VIFNGTAAWSVSGEPLVIFPDGVLTTEFCDSTAGDVAIVNTELLPNEEVSIAEFDTAVTLLLQPPKRAETRPMSITAIIIVFFIFNFTFKTIV
jgi:hypothetical protein